MVSQNETDPRASRKGSASTARVQQLKIAWRAGAEPSGNRDRPNEGARRNAHAKRRSRRRGQPAGRRPSGDRNVAADPGGSRPGHRPSARGPRRARLRRSGRPRDRCDRRGRDRRDVFDSARRAPSMRAARGCGSGEASVPSSTRSLPVMRDFMGVLGYFTPATWRARRGSGSSRRAESASTAGRPGDAGSQRRR